MKRFYPRTISYSEYFFLEAKREAYNVRWCWRVMDVPLKIFGLFELLKFFVT